MALPNIFSKEVSDQVIERINSLKPDTQPKWGKMNISQMLAHCNVTYEMVYESNHAKPNLFMGFILKFLVKNKVTNEMPYKQSLQTSPAFIMSDDKDFEVERARLISYIKQTQQLGEAHFHNKASLSFGVLTREEWNNMFYKHLNHHLSQFGV